MNAINTMIEQFNFMRVWTVTFSALAAIVVILCFLMWKNSKQRATPNTNYAERIYIAFMVLFFAQVFILPVISILFGTYASVVYAMVCVPLIALSVVLMLYYTAYWIKRKESENGL